MDLPSVHLPSQWWRRHGPYLCLNVLNVKFLTHKLLPRFGCLSTSGSLLLRLTTLAALMGRLRPRFGRVAKQQSQRSPPAFQRHLAFYDPSRTTPRASQILTPCRLGQRTPPPRAEPSANENSSTALNVLSPHISMPTATQAMLLVKSLPRNHSRQVKRLMLPETSSTTAHALPCLSRTLR